MKVRKKQLIRWLADYVSIMGEVWGGPRRISLESGRGILFCPADILKVLIDRKVVSCKHGAYFFHFEGLRGETFIEVTPSLVSEGIFILLIDDIKRMNQTQRKDETEKRP